MMEGAAATATATATASPAATSTATATVGDRKREVEPHKVEAEPQPKLNIPGLTCFGCIYREVAEDVVQFHRQKLGVEEDYSPFDHKAYIGRESRFLAEAALAYYNGKEGLKLECVEAMQSSAIVEEHNDYDWFHVNFKARDPNSPGPSDKIFFAEVMLSKDHDVEALSDHGIILSVQIIDLSNPDVVKRCRYCYFVYHPVGGYKVGVVPKGWTRPHEEECLDGLIGPDDILLD